MEEGRRSGAEFTGAMVASALFCWAIDRTDLNLLLEFERKGTDLLSGQKT